MSRQFGMIVLVVGFALGFATATLLFRQGADDSGLRPKGRMASVEKHIQGPESNSSSIPQANMTNIDGEALAAPVSRQNSEEGVRTPSRVQDKEAIRFVWGDLIDELGLDTGRANQLARIVSDPAKLREELGDAGYQAYLNYLPTLPIRQEIAPFKAALAQRNIPLDHENEKALLQIVREERPSRQPGEVNDIRSQRQMRERIYNRASGIFSGEVLSVFKAWAEGRS